MPVPESKIDLSKKKQEGIGVGGDKDEIRKRGAWVAQH